LLFVQQAGQIGDVNIFHAGGQLNAFGSVVNRRAPQT